MSAPDISEVAVERIASPPLHDLAPGAWHMLRALRAALTEVERQRDELAALVRSATAYIHDAGRMCHCDWCNRRRNALSLTKSKP